MAFPTAACGALSWIVLTTDHDAYANASSARVVAQRPPRAPLPARRHYSWRRSTNSRQVPPGRPSPDDPLSASGFAAGAPRSGGTTAAFRAVHFASRSGFVDAGAGLAPPCSFEQGLLTLFFEALTGEVGGVAIFWCRHAASGHLHVGL